MRIGIDIRALMEGKTTGVEIYLVNLLNNLFAIDKKNEYLLFANSFKQISLPKFDYPNVKTVITKYPNKFFNLAQKFLRYPKVDKLLGGADVFFSPHWRETALSKNTPLIVTFHDLFFEIMPEFFTTKRRLWHRFMNYRGAAKRAKKIIAVSESTKRDLVEIYGVLESKIEVVYSGIKSGNGGSGNNDYFLFLGTFEPRKNIGAVVEAYQNYFSQGGKRRLILAGSAGWGSPIKIPAELKSMIEVRKDINEQEKEKLYQNAFALIFPSFYEGFGFPVLEAASADVPVIASYNSALSEVAKDFALYVNPLRPSSISEAMMRIEDDKQLKDSFVDRGHRAASDFTWEKTARRTLELFNSAI